MADGVWLNLGSAVVMPEVFLKAVAVARNFGHDLDGLVTANLDKEVAVPHAGERAEPARRRGHRADRPPRDPAPAAARRRRRELAAATACRRAPR